MKKKWNILKAHWIMTWLIIAALMLTSVVSYAAYTRITVAKRVVSTEAGEGIRFSSDYLIGSPSIVPFSETITPIPVHIYNYPAPNIALPRNADTHYNMTVEIGTLVNGTFISANSAVTGGYKVRHGDDEYDFSSGASHQFTNCVIAGKQAHEDTFEVIFPESELEVSNGQTHYFIQMTAEPTKDIYELQTLTGVIGVSKSDNSTQSSWKGYLQETTDQSDYNGYNYIIEGNGKGVFTFSWNPTYLSINQQFLNNRNSTIDKTNLSLGDNGILDEDDIPTVNGMKSLTLKVDSTTINHYDIQFYKKAGFDVTKLSAYLPNTDETAFTRDDDGG